MRKSLFRIDTYLKPDEAFHYARKDLDPSPPEIVHTHDYFELFLVEQGRTRHAINGVEETLGVGDMVFIRPADIHAFQADAELGCRIMNVMFRVETAEHIVTRYAEDFAGRLFWSDGDLPVTVHMTGAQRERAINSIQSMRNTRRSLARIEHFLLSVMTHVLDEAATIHDRAPTWLVTACQEARRPEIFRRGAAGFVASAGRGHEHVCRQARRYLGVSPTEYVNRVRMQHAAMLLGTTRLTMQEVAQECGLENLSHFHRLFREIYGTTPRQYRQRGKRDPIQSGAVTA
ncbi:MAG: helix-turn-helix domain-containing protein [Roseicyclus sp.]|nr:helix-turn-helix domain-containing protein [Roseicyclus sp.]MBO6624993.1 helix-turn-helix domain-containing protein [Roseicyclus sp.]MBO6921941.1 helix-turn-helix domain-containing protein [Roseicyclus sp.]